MRPVIAVLCGVAIVMLFVAAWLGQTDPQLPGAPASPGFAVIAAR